MFSTAKCKFNEVLIMTKYKEYIKIPIKAIR